MKLIKQLIVIGIFGVAIMIGVSAMGLYNPTRARLIGKWDVSFAMTQADWQQMGVTNNPLAEVAAETLVSAIQAEMQVEFRDDDTASLDVTTFGVLASEAATWKIASTKDGQATISIAFSKDQAENEWSIRFVDNDTFRMDSPKDSRFPVGKMVLFRRVAKNKAD
jgi:hypothetical protein